MKRVVFLFIVLSTVSTLFGQFNNDLKKYYSDKAGVMTDSVLNSNKLYLDTLYLDFDSTFKSITIDYDTYYRDSVYLVTKDSINSLRLDSLNIMSSLLKSRISALYTAFKDSLRPFFTEFESAVRNSKQEYSSCDDCEEVEDYYDRLDEYDDVLDSVSSDFQDNSFSLYDSLESALTDSAGVYMDSIYNYAQTLQENQFDEDELKDDSEKIISEGNSFDENYSKISIDAAYQNHVAFRGRDNGIYQNSFSPSFTFEHSSGLGASAIFYFVNKTQKVFDEFDLNAYFDFDITNNLNADISYTRYWFGDSSNNAKSVFQNTLSGDLTYDLDYVYFATSLFMDFSGSQSEFGILLGAAAPVTLSEKFIGGILGTEPSIYATFGEQNSFFISGRRNRRGVTILAPGKNSSFGVMDYEITLPLIYTTKYLSVKPYATLIVPLNVLDNSTRNPFVNFAIEVSVPFNLKW